MENIAICIQQYSKRKTPQIKLDLFLTHSINLPFDKSTNLALHIYKIKVKKIYVTISLDIENDYIQYPLMIKQKLLEKYK